MSILPKIISAVWELLREPDGRQLATFQYEFGKEIRLYYIS